MMTLNCDIGERGTDNALDLDLMKTIHIANIACGGHAGDADSVLFFTKLAQKNDVKISAHLSYPDRENFGRKSMDLPEKDLLASLDNQYHLLEGVTRLIKFHGALYNDSCVYPSLADILTGWLVDHDTDTVITLPGGKLDLACRSAGIHVLREAFAERRYAWDQRHNCLTLVSRSRSYAFIHDPAEAYAQAEGIITRHSVEAISESREDVYLTQTTPLEADTICVHSDSPISLELAPRLFARLNRG